MDNEKPNLPESPFVHGCTECQSILQIDWLYVSGEQPFANRCPSCASPLMELGKLPYYVEHEGQLYFINEAGVTTGPYNSPEEARDHLWDWFTKEGYDGEEESIPKEKGISKGHLRLASVGGVSIEEGSRKEGRAKEETD